MGKFPQKAITNIFCFAGSVSTLPMLAIPKILKTKISSILERIKKLISLQDDLYIEPKNKIEIIQDRRDHSLEIRDESYFREQKQIERDDFDLEM